MLVVSISQSPENEEEGDESRSRVAAKQRKSCRSMVAGCKTSRILGGTLPSERW